MAVLAFLTMPVAGCLRQPVVTRAIRARGGPLQGLVREVEAEVRTGFPGTWRWRTVFLLPDRYAWTIYTTDQPDYYVFDAGITSSFIGGRLLSRERGPTPLRSHARFAAVQDLDTLLLPGVTLTPLAPADRPAGTAVGATAVFADDGARYRLGFDDEGQLVVVEGPLELPPFGNGVVEARVTEFRRMGGMTLPARVAYRMGDQPFADERTLAACPNPAALDVAAFAAPERLPQCPIAPE